MSLRSDPLRPREDEIGGYLGSGRSRRGLQNRSTRDFFPGRRPRPCCEHLSPPPSGSPLKKERNQDHRIRKAVCDSSWGVTFSLTA